MNIRNLLCCCYIFCSISLFCYDIPSLNYLGAHKSDKHKALSKDLYLSVDNANAISLYSENQIQFFMQHDKDVLKDFIREEGLQFVIVPNDVILINDMQLTKTLVFKEDREGYYPGYCVYLNLDDEYRRTHTYFGDTTIYTVFNKNGDCFLLADYFSTLSIYPITNLTIKNGISYKLQNTYINYINQDSKQLMYYNVENGITGYVKNIPPLYKPKLCYGLNTKQPASIDDFALQDYDQYTCVIPGGMVYHHESKAKHPDGTRYYWNTIYLLDYDFDGTRKKGVYKIMGDKFEFYPDL